ncbi:hypothetical protein [Brucella intermedia]|uniref:hypothetical protein n=1 Tax=Brucella intermedia TaxID=94625 RepID=UPI00124CC889|nr:hypothetical protein [Brucella intermedia]KAB2733605.1 hypothetical protein F9L02_01100 [Brucella intermedia]
MTESLFTPGPWETGQASWNEDGEVRYTLHGVFDAKTADAYLIAAAPDLYTTLDKQLKNWIALIESGDAGHWNPDEDEHVLLMRATLAKARGEQET